MFQWYTHTLRRERERESREGDGWVPLKHSPTYATIQHVQPPRIVMGNLRAGRVVSVRVNPRDCQSVLDLVERLPVPFSQDMSFAQHVSLALSSLLETARQQGLLPEPDQFQYLNRMERFGFNRHAHGRKLAITETIGTLGSEFKAPVANKVSQEYVEPELTMEQKRAWTRIRELTAKMELAEQEGSGVVWSASDQAEYDRLAQLV